MLQAVEGAMLRQQEQQDGESGAAASRVDTSAGTKLQNKPKRKRKSDIALSYMRCVLGVSGCQRKLEVIICFGQLTVDGHELLLLSAQK